jgi:hypothetical protein
LVILGRADLPEVEAESVRAGGNEQSRASDEQFALFPRPFSVLARWFVSISIGSAGVGAVRWSVFARSSFAVISAATALVLFLRAGILQSPHFKKK